MTITLSEHYAFIMKHLHTQVCIQYLNKECNNEYCIFSHSKIPKRRVLNNTPLFNYMPLRCQNATCKDSCTFAHSEEEMYFHPLFYKTKRCFHEMKNGQCLKFGVFCPFVHSEVEKRSPDQSYSVTNEFNILTFKTIKCERICECNGLKYHNSKDKRRHNTEYMAKKCPKLWNDELNEWRKDIICSNSCIYSHSWAEIMFHPLNYKTAHCKRWKDTNPPRCVMGITCGHAHGDNELRKRSNNF